MEKTPKFKVGQAVRTKSGIGGRSALVILEVFNESYEHGIGYDIWQYKCVDLFGHGVLVLVPYTWWAEDNLVACNEETQKLADAVYNSIVIQYT